MKSKNYFFLIITEDECRFRKKSNESGVLLKGVDLLVSVENYSKGKTTEVGDIIDLQFDENAVHMRVAAGSKIKNLMGFAMKQIKDTKIKQITWNGTGPGISKALTCAEIMKRKIKGLHQITQVRFKRIEEYWEPQMEGLERLKVNRDIPAITILLSKTPLDTNIPGYQPPGSFDAFWKKLSSNVGDKTAKKQTKSSDAATADSPAYGSLTKRKRKRATGKEGIKGEGQDSKDKPKPRKKSGPTKQKEEKSNSEIWNNDDQNEKSNETVVTKVTVEMDVDT